MLQVLLVRRIPRFAPVCALLICSRSAAAQQTLQQPVVETFSVDTVVSVPDRGGALWGGIGTASETRRDFGPLPWGTATGRSVSSSRVDVGVSIHDFEALDAALLAAPTRRSQFGRQSPRFRSPRAAAAWRVLHE